MSRSTAAEPPAPPRKKTPPDRPFYELTKPGIAGFVAITAGVSYFVAAQGRPDFMPVIHTLLGSGIATGGALALNQYVERDLDARMKRTRGRPIPSGRVAPRTALVYGLALTTVGILWLGLTVGLLPAALTALSAVLYIGAYTPLKRISYSATLVGAVPGAIPALIGWTAATGSLDPGGWILFGIYFLWQLPHALGLAWVLRDDYREVGFFLTPPTDPDGRRLGRHLVCHSISLLLVSLMPAILGITGWIYGVGAFLLSSGMLAAAILSAIEMTTERARRVFLGSLLYQVVLLILLLIDTTPPGGG